MLGTPCLKEMRLYLLIALLGGLIVLLAELATDTQVRVRPVAAPSQQESAATVSQPGL